MQATEIGAAKANLPAGKIFALSILGGFFIAFGGALAISVGPACPGLASSNPGLLKILTGIWPAVLSCSLCMTVMKSLLSTLPLGTAFRLPTHLLLLKLRRRVFAFCLAILR